MLTRTFTDNSIVYKFKNWKRLSILIAETVEYSIIGSIYSKEKNIILTLEGIEFIDTTALNMLCGLATYFKENGKSFYLTNISEDVMFMIKYMNMENILNIYQGPIQTEV